jgi:hypothetical protein
VRLCLWSAAANWPIHPPGDTWAWKTIVEWYWHGRTHDLPTRALWQSYWLSHLVANEGELGKGNDEFSLRNICLQSDVTCHKILQYEADNFSFPPKEGVLWIFSPLRIHHIGWVWTCALSVQGHAR